MYLYETHMHTSTVSACAVSSPAEQVRAYKRRGYAGVIITDHFLNGLAARSPGKVSMSWADKINFFVSGYERAKKEGDKCGLDVFFGWEYSIDGSDFLTYGLNEDFLIAHPELEDTPPIEKYSTLVRDAGGYIAQAHPYRRGLWINMPLPVEPSLIDGVEVYNGGMPMAVNKKAFDFALEHGLPMQAGSDSHDTDIRDVNGISLRNKAESIHDIIKAIKARQVKLILPPIINDLWN